MRLYINRASVSAMMRPFRLSFLKSTCDLRGDVHINSCRSSFFVCFLTINAPNRILSLHCVKYRASERRFGIFQVRQGKARDPSEAIALMLPGNCGLNKIYLLVNQSHLHPGKSRINHLNGKTNKQKDMRPFKLTGPYLFCQTNYLLQLLNERVHRSVRLWRTGHMHKELITLTQGIQTHNERHIVMKQA